MFDSDLKRTILVVADLISSHSRDGTALSLLWLSRQKCRVSLDSVQESFKSFCAYVCVCVCGASKMKPREHQLSRILLVASFQIVPV